MKYRAYWTEEYSVIVEATDDKSAIEAAEDANGAILEHVGDIEVKRVEP